MSGDDVTHMRRAIELARAGVGRTGDNPSVGCVIVQDSRVLAEAATGPGGRPHAEEQALQALGGQAPGATVYVTLEPCAERSSAAPSCAERLAAAGVARVVVACQDPSPMAGGRGMNHLRVAGLRIDLGVLHAEAAPLYAAYRP
jgi:pyrimidine deaminase RibD-like protein